MAEGELDLLEGGAADRLPPSWEPLKSILKRLKVKVPSDLELTRALLFEGEEIARDLKTMEERVKRLAKRICARP